MKTLSLVLIGIVAMSLIVPLNVQGINTDNRPFQNVHALTVLSATNWVVVGTGVADMADAIDEWVPDGATSYAYTTNNLDVATLKLSDLKPADPYTFYDQTQNQSLTVSMMSVGSGIAEAMFVYLYVCSLGPPPGGLIINTAFSLSRTAWTPIIIKAFADLTGYWDDLCIGFQGRLIAAGEQARITWAEMRVPPAKISNTRTDNGPMIFGIFSLSTVGMIALVVVKKRREKPSQH